MSAGGLLGRAAELFLAPADGASRPAAPARRRALPVAGAPAAAVLGAPGQARGVALLLAAELRLRARAACALAGEWTGGEAGPGGPARLGAGRAPRALAERLAERGLDASTRGRVVHLSLPPEAGEATAAWSRALAAAACPAVLAVAGPRPPAFDVVLGGLDLVVLVCAAGDELTELALEGLAGVRAPVITCRPVGAGAQRLLRASSLATSRALGAHVVAAAKELTA